MVSPSTINRGFVCQGEVSRQKNTTDDISPSDNNKAHEKCIIRLAELNDNNPDSITALFCCDPHVATKTHTMTSEGLTTKAFNAGFLFCSRVIPVNNISDLSEKLSMIESITTALVIRGLPLPHVKLNIPHVRRKHGPDATYQSPADGHHYFMVDIDKLALPKGLLLTPDNVPAVIAFVVSILPKEFHNASFHYQLSSSAGLRDETRASMHLWFWSDRKLTDDELKRWGKHVNQQVGYKLIDSALFNDVQPHFVAAPIFVGMDDPFSKRSGLIRNSDDSVSVLIPDPVIKPPKAASARQTSRNLASENWLGQSSTQGFENLLAEIGDHPGGDGFNTPIIRAIASHITTVSAEKFDREWLKVTMRERILEADASNHDHSYIETKISDHYLDSAIDGAILKFGHKKAARLIPGQPPHYQTKRVSANDAIAQLKSAIRRFFR